jgi:hypothetical protein
MKRVALGIRMHSGWRILVAVNDEADVIDRRRIVVTHAEGFRGKQPFHQAEALGLERAESFLEHYSADCHALARAQISDAVANYGARGYSVATAAILLASGRTLPALRQILASHALIHAAEGELFRRVARRACESLGIPVMEYRERDLQQLAHALRGAQGINMTDKVATLGKSLGPPWTADHKSAALAGYLALSSNAQAKAVSPRC